MALRMKTILVYRPEVDDESSPFSGIEVIGNIIGLDPQHWIDQFVENASKLQDTSEWQFYTASEPPDVETA